MTTEEQLNSILERIEALEHEIESLKEENENLSDRIDDLESEISDLDYSGSPEDDEEDESRNYRLQPIEEEEDKKRLEQELRIEEAAIKSRRENEKKYIDASKSDEDAVIVSENTCEIDNNVFFERGFTSLTIPSSVTKIGSKFCFHCTMLRTVKFLGTCPEGLEQAFDECWRLKEIIVPEAELENFKAALLPEYNELIRSLR